jgi:hypothetical protein
MRRYLHFLLAAAVGFGAAFGLLQGGVRGQAVDVGPTVVSRETQGDNVREILAPAESNNVQPQIGFIDSPSATCYQPNPALDDCRVKWYYLSVNATPNYMITMTVSLNAIGPIAHVQGFFQNSMYVPYNMLGDGVAVKCGALGAGGNPELGNAYAYTIRARDSANLGSVNYGTVYCPAFKP